MSFSTAWQQLPVHGYEYRTSQGCQARSMSKALLVLQHQPGCRLRSAWWHCLTSPRPLRPCSGGPGEDKRQPAGGDCCHVRCCSPGPYPCPAGNALVRLQTWVPTRGRWHHARAACCCAQVAAEALKKYVDTYSGDKEAWEELGELYVQVGRVRGSSL